MIDNYTSDCCYPGMDIYPDCDLNRWSTQKTITILANADYYYTAKEVDEIIEQTQGMTEEQVRALIEEYTRNLASKQELDALAEQVRQNTTAILNTYTKPEVNSLLANYYTKLQTNSMFANYSKVEGTTLSLNDGNII